MGKEKVAHTSIVKLSFLFHDVNKLTILPVNCIKREKCLSSQRDGINYRLVSQGGG